ncbi:MAG: hypothetical protein A3G45_01325 [Candidatus Staskawiczbacteria bacterium RIFCSPLOWO2_12_FULL_37_15]|uniref:Uncharacterized protein n=1 Tax=Candidatus Staskawiczbacteria bacterium RIFCSPLOWO2_12_FULL_37_15 TaxID=1802218 RepID=A0A1G2IRS9_9BACT|nr:MAG: hypothetical protein A3G45_01325 [Candidatus Staskawiczbacteria bacterium RIFCSPLOWO2_12_FULL_37_15]
MLLVCFAIVLVVSLVQNLTVARKEIELWKEIARIAGVKQFHELADGEYQMGVFFGKVGQCMIYRIYEVARLGVDDEAVVVFPAGEYIESEFTVKNGKIS